MITPQDLPTHIHGSAVLLGEMAVLIRGRSGAGKSTLALALVETFRREGDFARLIGDDRVALRLSSGRAVLSPHRALAGVAEWRGVGLLEQEFEPKAVLALIVDLEANDAKNPPTRMPERQELSCDFNGLKKMPRLRLPVRETSRSVAAVMTFLHKLSTK
jgi:serine kinase of HPr protein (carbohydrate metabolism regulator)